MGESEQSRMLGSILPVAFTKLVRPRCGYCSCMFGNNGALARHMKGCKELLAEEQQEEDDVDDKEDDDRDDKKEDVLMLELAAVVSEVHDDVEDDLEDDLEGDSKLGELGSRASMAPALAPTQPTRKRPLPPTANESRSAAEDEGLELVPSSSSETGFKGVTKHHGKYKAEVRDNGKQRHLGTFATPEEAALCYARHIGAERAAAEAAEARGEKRQPLTADEARAAAAAEELELVPSSSNETGFKGVRKLGGKYYANMMENSVLRYLGCFATPEEASLARARYIRDLVDGWLIPGRRPPHRPVLKAPTPAPDPDPPSPFPSEVELAEALRCWRLLLTAMRDDQRNQQGSSSSSALPPPSPAVTTKHASRKRPAVAVAFAEVGVPRAEALQPQLTAKSGDDPGAARCVICLEALNLSAASASSRGEAACGHTPCCGNYFHKRCLSQWLQGSWQSDNDPLPIERLDKKCPTCRREQLVARTLVPGPCPQRLCK